MAGRRRTWRRVVLLGVPSLYVLLGLLHPTHNPELGDETDHFVNLHIAQLFLIAGLGYVLWLLVEGVTNRAATLARALIIPFLVAYTALDAILGIAWGSPRDSERPAHHGPAGSRSAHRRADSGNRTTGPHPLLGCRPALACGGACGRRRAQDTAPLGALVSMAVGAAVFTLGHAPPVVRSEWDCSSSASRGPSSAPVQQRRCRQPKRDRRQLVRASLRMHADEAGAPGATVAGTGSLPCGASGENH